MTALRQGHRPAPALAEGEEGRLTCAVDACGRRLPAGTRVLIERVYPVRSRYRPTRFEYQARSIPDGVACYLVGAEVMPVAGDGPDGPEGDAPEAAR